MRNKTIDVMKGIGILLVVFAHINYQEPAQTIIYSFHMPLFFLISGYLFDTSKYSTLGSLLHKRFQTLLIPYLIFAFLGYVYNEGIWILAVGFTPEVLVSLRGQLLQIFIAQWSQVCHFNTPLWFVSSLLVVECLYWVVDKKVEFTYYKITLVVFLVCLGWYAESKHCPINLDFLPWNLTSALFSLGFYAIGNGFKRKQYFFSGCWLSNKWVASLTGIFCCVIVYVLSLYNGHVSIGSRVLKNGFVFYITGILGSYVIFLLAQLCKKSKILDFWGRNSFVIMGAHLLIKYVLYLVFGQLFHSTLDFSTTRIIPGLIVTAITMVLCSVVVFVYNRLALVFTKKRGALNV